MTQQPITPNSEPETTSGLTEDAIVHALEKIAPKQHHLAALTNTITGIPSPAPTPTVSDGTRTPLAELDASLLQCTHTTSPRSVPVPGSAEQLSQKFCTDHMIQARWNSSTGWEAPTIKPYGPLELMPTSSCLHYATQCFEGMKLYRGYDGKLRLFRPHLNCNRMLMSTTRIALPAFPPEELLKLIIKLCATDGNKWLPKDRPGSFLYIRPTMIATDSALGIQRPNEALLFVVLTCFASMDDVPGGLKLLASQDDMCRAWPGGFGYAKVGANYGPSLLSQGEARKRGFHQVLWLFGNDCTVTEAGASNFFAVWMTKEGRRQLITASLDEKIVLDGVTRRSTLELARSRLSDTSSDTDLPPLEVVERKFTMSEIEEAANDGRLIEAFAVGTAWFVAPVSHIHFRGKDLEVPMAEGDVGSYTKVLKQWLKGIMWGLEGSEKHEWGHVIAEE